MKRRSFIKGVGAALFAPKLLNGEPKAPVIANGCDPTKEWNSPSIYFVKWHNRWWKADGSMVSWTESGIKGFARPEDFVHHTRIPTMEVCVGLCRLLTCPGVLFWVGGYGSIWYIETDHSNTGSYRFSKNVIG